MSAHAFDADEADRMIAHEMARARAFYGEDGGGAAPLLPVLHAMQEAFGFIPSQAQLLIASKLNISQAEVRGVVSFYHDFRVERAGRHVLKLCRAEACQARGCERVAAHFEQAHGLHAGATTPDGALTLESVYCVGNCALGPAALLDDRLIGRIDEARADLLVSEARQ